MRHSTALPIAYVFLRILILLNWVFAGCVLALLGHFGASATVLAACSQCFICIGESGGREDDPGDVGGTIPIDRRIGGWSAIPGMR